MKNAVVKLTVDPQKFEATQQFMQEKGVDIESELSNSVAKFYQKYVPADIRKHMESSSARRASPSVSKAKERGTGSD